MRRIVEFICEDCRLIGSVDSAEGTTGALIVSGGNEVRTGAHRGMALLAQRLAAEGVPVFRFDRRGVGDSEGENRGYGQSGPDITAALATFRREQPQMRRVLGFGNCDGAAALLLHDRGCDALVLANPWLGDEDATLPPATVRAHYLRRLRDPAAWRRLVVRGLSGIFNNIRAAVGRAREQPLASRVAAALTMRPTTIVLARGDRTAQVFAGSIALPPGTRAVTIDTASHSFAGDDDALARVIREAVRALDDKDVA